MALFVDKCAICGETITRDTPLLTTWGVAFPEHHRLFRFCDAGFHQACLLRWRDCGEYAQGYFDLWLLNHAGGRNGSLLEVADQSKWLLGSGPFLRTGGKLYWPLYVQLIPRSFPIRLKCDFAKWTGYITNEWQAGLIADVVKLLEPTLSEVRARYPDVASLEKRLGVPPNNPPRHWTAAAERPL